MERKVTHVLILGVAALALACGGGTRSEAPAPPAPVATVALSGMVTGTSGALTFGREPLLTGGALVTAQGKPATTAKIQPGSVIQGTATKTVQGYLLQSADVHHEVEGIIDSVDVVGSKIVIMGQIVKVDALTIIEEEGPGDTYTHLPTTEGPVLASRIEREPASSNHEESFHGLVSALDTTAKTFLAGGYTVSYGTAMVTGILANGVKVEIHGTLSGLNLAATSVKVEPAMEATPDADLEVCGTISGLDLTAKTFLLMSYKVDYSAAKVEGILANGARVEVEGTLGAGAVPVLTAQKVEVAHTDSGSGASDKEREGLVTAVSTPDKTLTVGADTYWTDSATLFVKRDASAVFADVAVGVKVELHVLSTRTNAAGQAYATKVEIHHS
jgi:Domain of unknown function (DUF5666)